MALRWRSGTSSAELSCTTMSRLGRARPDSRKLTWRCDTPDCRASASWLAPRRRRQARSIGPNRSGWTVAVGRGLFIMHRTLTSTRGSADYLQRNWRAGAAMALRLARLDDGREAVMDKLAFLNLNQLPFAQVLGLKY